MWVECFQTLQLREVSAGVHGCRRITLADVDARIREHNATVFSNFRERVIDMCQIFRGQISDAGSLAPHIPRSEIADDAVWMRVRGGL